MKSIYLVTLFCTLVIGVFAQTSDSIGLQKSLGEVTVSASSGNMRRHIEGTQMGKLDIPLSMLSKAPSLAGEPDVIKALQLTPGVKRGSEGNIGMFVRGGGNDGNLILLDGAPVYNAGHLLGFFSVFNTAAVKDVDLYKSSFPAQYGGRLSSVLDIRTKEGCMTDYKASAGIGLISSSLAVQGPIVNDKLSFMVAGRRTYIDKVFKYVPYYFYDVNTKLTYIVNSRNRLYLSSYIGDDVLHATNMGGTSDKEQTVNTSMKLGNKTMTLRWNHTAEDGKFSADIATTYSQFKYDIGGKMGTNNLSMRSAIRDIALKGDVKYNRITDHKLSAGFNLINHYFNPNIVSSSGALLEKFGNSPGKKIYNYEGAVYVNDEYHINDKWQLAAGMRLSGATTNNSIYINAEPRIGARYLVDDRNSIKASYARMSQYMHLVSSSSMALPSDLWYPVTNNVLPSISDQASAGYYHAMPSCGLTMSAEVYYKWMHHLVEYKEGALLTLNDNYEDELVTGTGRAYGLELFVSKTTGKFTGWVGYSLSYSQRSFDSLNQGQEYYSRFDRRHDVSLVGMYDLSNRWCISTSVLYATGSPFTGQTSQYMVPKPDFSGVDILPGYSGRNEYRMSAAFRVDVDLSYKFRFGKWLRGDAHFSVYNVFNRTQPHRVERVWDKNKNNYAYRQVGLFGTITTASVNFNF